MLENILNTAKKMICIIPLLYNAGCGPHQADFVPQKNREQTAASVDARQQDTEPIRPYPIPDEDLSPEQDNPEPDAEEDSFYGPDGCPRRNPEFDEYDYLRLLLKYHRPEFSDPARDRELACFGLTKFPDYVLKGRRPSSSDILERLERQSKTVERQPAKTPPETPTHAMTPPEDTSTTYYTEGSWYLGRNDILGIRAFVQRHNDTKCFTIEGHGGGDGSRAASERAGGLLEYLPERYGLSAKILTLTEPIGLGRLTIIRAGCD